MEPEDLETLCDLATEFSRYAAAETLREGYLPRPGRVPGGPVRHGGDEGRRQHQSAGALLRRDPHCPGEARASPRPWPPGCSGRASSAARCCSRRPAAARPRCCGTWCRCLSAGAAGVAAACGWPSSTSGARWRSCCAGRSPRWTWAPGPMCWTPAPRRWASPWCCGP